MLHWDLGPTNESIAQAKHDMWEERAAVERQTGLRLRDGHPTVVMGCPHVGCCFSTRPALNQGKALRALVSHIVQCHRKES